MKVFDYYSGFEGEPEILIIQKSQNGQNVALLKLWIAYFDSIIELIKPNTQGYWEGVPLHHNLSTGWHDGEPWECNNVNLFSQQLNSVNENELKIGKSESVGRISFDVLNLLRSMLKDTIDSNGKIVIKYD